MKLRSKIGISVTIFLLIMGHATAGWFGADFSADTYQVSPQGQMRLGKMYVSDGRVRTEMLVRGKPMVEIIDSTRGKAWLLEPEIKTYRERPVPIQRKDSVKGDPCQVNTVTRCQALGKELVNGRPATKWQLQVKQQQRLLWLDEQHHFPVQAVIDGKMVMMMRFIGKESVENRRVEKWEATEISPAGNQVSVQWYDPELNIAIRQQAATGEIRELKNIQLGKQQESLFTLPSGYQRDAVQ